MQLLKTDWDASRTAKASVIRRSHYYFEWPRRSGEISDENKKRDKIIHREENPGNNREGYTTNPPVSHFHACKGQKSDWEHSA